IIPALVDREDLVPASAAMHQTFQWARVASPGSAAILVAHFSEKACFWADAASFILSALLLATIRCHVPRTKTESAPASRAVARVRRDMRSGIAFLFSDADLSFATLAMTAGTFATGCYSSLVGVYVRDVMHAGMRVYGALGSLIAIGMLTGSL